MFPLRDSIRARRTPVVTIALVAINIAAFVWEVRQGGGIEDAITRFGLVPERMIAALRAGHPFPELGTVATSMFLHADILHLLGNLWFLWIFGDNVEDRLGRAKYLAFYLACGCAAAASQVFAAPHSALPMIGASGAIAGVLGAYMRMYPGARVLTVLPIFVFVQFFEIRAIVFLGLWFLVQVGSSLLDPGTGGGVAWWAHIAGFATGVLLTLPFGHVPAPRPAPPRQRVRRRSYGDG